MSYKLKDIIYETKNHWVLRVKNGFEVYKVGVTHSTRVSQIGYDGRKGEEKAIMECDKREALVI